MFSVFHSLLACSNNLHYEKFADGSVKCIEDEIPFDLPEGWAWAFLSNIVYVLNGDRGQSYPAKSKLRSKGIPFVSASNIQDGVVSSDGLLCLSDSQYDALGAGKLFAGDIVYCIRGSLGKCGLFTMEKGAIASSLVIVRSLFDAPHIIDYIFLYLNSALAAGEIKKYDNGSAQPNLAAKDFRHFLVPLPPQAEMQRINKQAREALVFVKRIQNNKDELHAAIAVAKAKILDLAIRGQLVPQDPSDEPASVLLEHIRAEKEELIRQGKIKRDKKESVIFRGEDNSYYQKVEADGSVVIQRVDVPPTWAVCCLQEISYPVSTVGMQIKSEEIQKDGVFPVISQGQSFIDGYYSDESKVIYASPIILFGDHTRNVKYIDFPFVVGADGTKLHKVIRANERYVYYWMCHASQCIADRRYARHYSLLQKECFTLPPIAEQIRIVNCIDQLFAQLDSIADALL